MCLLPRSARVGEQETENSIIQMWNGSVLHEKVGTEIVCFQRKLDDVHALLKRKEKEFEETMDHLQADIDSLETERGELKEKLKNITKKAVESGAKSGKFVFQPKFIQCLVRDHSHKICTKTKNQQSYHEK